MPELGPKKIPFGERVRDFSSKELEFIDDNQLKNLAESYNEKYIGSGGEAVVIKSKEPSRSDRVIAFNYRDISPEQAKITFYLQRIFSTLFPRNFPRFYVSAGEDPKGVKFSGTIRHEIKSDVFGYGKAAYPFYEVRDICKKELGIELPIDYGNETNFLQGMDGGEYYVDTLKDGAVQKWDIDKILRYMESRKYSKEDMQTVKSGIERVKKLKLAKSIQEEYSHGKNESQIRGLLISRGWKEEDVNGILETRAA